MKQSWKSCLVGGLVALSLTACGGDDDNTPEPIPVTPTAQRVVVEGNIKGDTTWTADKVWVLRDNIFVESGTLTIEAGTRIEGEGRSSLAITTGGRLKAVGTKDKPIVFTSTKAPGSRAAGDWGGVVLLGKAPINVVTADGSPGTASIEGYPATQPGIAYGGSDATHDCGELRYVRIEFAGFKLSSNNELNGLTAGGCGSKTVLDYIQVHKGNDDGVEMFGGTANLKHILITQPDDDGLDWDLGYSGKVQFLIVQLNQDVGNFAFESDNNPNQPAAATPVSTPEVWNATLIGSNAAKAGKTQGGMHLKNGTAGRMNNLIVAHFTDWALDVDGVATRERLTDSAHPLFIKSSLFWDNKDDTTSIPTVANPQKDGAGKPIAGTDVTQFDEQTLVAPGNTYGNRVLDPQLTDALNLLKPNFTPKTGSPALNPDNAAPLAGGDGFFEASRFVGAIGTEDWTAGWTDFPAS
ncbi:hypothetical protein P2318_01405 [Myxococcaceae bacterium GXIMD 01537]